MPRKQNQNTMGTSGILSLTLLVQMSNRQERKSILKPVKVIAGLLELTRNPNN